MQRRPEIVEGFDYLTRKVIKEADLVEIRCLRTGISRINPH